MIVLIGIIGIIGIIDIYDIVSRNSNRLESIPGGRSVYIHER
jgi:hypothetical protein